MQIYQEKIGLLDLLTVVLEIDQTRADDYYKKFRKVWFNAKIAEPSFVIVDKIEDEGVIGVFYEDYRKNQVYLTDNIFDFNEDGRLFYLTHEIVHYTDFHSLGDCRSENETDSEALRILTSWGIWNEETMGQQPEISFQQRKESPILDPIIITVISTVISTILLKWLIKND